MSGFKAFCFSLVMVAYATTTTTTIVTTTTTTPTTPPTTTTTTTTTTSTTTTTTTTITTTTTTKVGGSSSSGSSNVLVIVLIISALLPVIALSVFFYLWLGKRKALRAQEQSRTELMMDHVPSQKKDPRRSVEPKNAWLEDEDGLPRRGVSSRHASMTASEASDESLYEKLPNLTLFKTDTPVYAKYLTPKGVLFTPLSFEDAKVAYQNGQELFTRNMPAADWKLLQQQKSQPPSVLSQTGSPPNAIHPQPPVQQVKKSVDPQAELKKKRILEDVNSDVYGNAVMILKTMITPASSVQMGEKIDGGYFGNVFAGFWTRPNDGKRLKVAIKTLKVLTQDSETGAALSSDQQHEFLKEMTTMAQLTHENLVRLLALVSSPMMIVMEFVSNGSLHDFVRAHPIFPLPLVINCAIHISRGCRYLVDHGVVHRDIAARNVLLHVESDHSFTCKLSDLGLARIMEKVYYKGHRQVPIPVRWTALESLLYNKWSQFSDVWSFGVFVWELTTMGQFPYTDIMEDNDVVDGIEAGLRLHQAAGVPNSLYQMLLKCWHHNSHERPTFAFLAQYFEDLLEEITQPDDGTASDDGEDFRPLPPTAPINPKDPVFIKVAMPPVAMYSKVDKKQVPPKSKVFVRIDATDGPVYKEIPIESCRDDQIVFVQSFAQPRVAYAPLPSGCRIPNVSVYAPLASDASKYNTHLPRAHLSPLESRLIYRNVDDGDFDEDGGTTLGFSPLTPEEKANSLKLKSRKLTDLDKQPYQNLPGQQPARQSVQKQVSLPDPSSSNTQVPVQRQSSLMETRPNSYEDFHIGGFSHYRNVEDVQPSSNLPNYEFTSPKNLYRNDVVPSNSKEVDPAPLEFTIEPRKKEPDLYQNLPSQSVDKVVPMKVGQADIFGEEARDLYSPLLLKNSAPPNRGNNKDSSDTDEVATYVPLPQLNNLPPVRELYAPVDSLGDGFGEEDYQEKTDTEKVLEWSKRILDRNEAEKILLASNWDNGAFLVRKSARDPALVLSLRHDGRVHHFKVRAEGGSVVLLDSYNGDKAFSSWDAFIDFYKTHDPNETGGLVTKLSYCIPSS